MTPPLLWLAPLLPLWLGPTKNQLQTFTSVLNTMLLSFATNHPVSVSDIGSWKAAPTTAG